jgi:hypothetical protein
VRKPPQKTFSKTLVVFIRCAALPLGHFSSLFHVPWKNLPTSVTHTAVQLGSWVSAAMAAQARPWRAQCGDDDGVGGEADGAGTLLRSRESRLLEKSDIDAFTVRVQSAWRGYAERVTVYTILQQVQSVAILGVPLVGSPSVVLSATILTTCCVY